MGATVWTITNGRRSFHGQLRWHCDKFASEWISRTECQLAERILCVRSCRLHLDGSLVDGSQPPRRNTSNQRWQIKVKIANRKFHGKQFGHQPPSGPSSQHNSPKVGAFSRCRRNCRSSCSMCWNLTSPSPALLVPFHTFLCVSCYRLPVSIQVVMIIL